MEQAKALNSRASIAWAYAQAWVGKGASALVYMALGYLLDPHEFGSYAVASTFVVLAEMFVEQTVAQAVIQLPDDKPEQLGSLKYIALLLGLACSGGTLLLSLFLWTSARPGELSMAWYAGELVLCPLLIAVNAVPIGLYRKAMDYKALARRTALATLGGGAVGIVVGAMHGGGHALVALTLTYQVLSYFILRGHHARIKLNVSWTEAQALRKLMIVNGQPKVADFLESKGLELVVAQFMGLSVAGTLSYANKIAQTLFTFLASPSLDAAWGLFSHHRDDKSALFGVYQRHLAILSMTTTTMFFALGMSAYQMIPFVLGSKWASLHQLLPWLCLALIVRTSLYLATILIQVFEPSLFVSSLAIGPDGDLQLRRPRL
jgi:PST family polysaccharide transporter